MSLLALYWKEALIGILIGSCFFAVKACEKAHDQATQIKAEDAALAQEAQRNADQKKADDHREYDNAKREFQNKIDELTSDHRIASVQCVRQPKSSGGKVPISPPAAAGIVAEVSSNVSQPSTFDPGPAIDALTRECDRLAVAHNELVDWIMATR